MRLGTKLAILAGNPAQAQSPQTTAWTRWLATLRPPHMQPQSAANLHGTAEVLGSPVTKGAYGNGPGVGYSGAGTQQNFLNKGIPK